MAFSFSQWPRKLTDAKIPDVPTDVTSKWIVEDCFYPHRNEDFKLAAL